MDHSENLNLIWWNLAQLTRSVIHNSKGQNAEQVVNLLQKALYCARHFDTQYTHYGPTVRQSQDSLQVAVIAAVEMSLDLDAVLAAILYTPFVEGFITQETVQREFSTRSAAILEELNILKSCSIKDDTIRYYTNDGIDLKSPHVLAVLLQLANVMHLYYGGHITKYTDSPTHKDLTAEDTRVLYDLKTFYIPLAHRMRLYDIQTKLSDFWFKHTNTLQYYYISAKLGISKLQRQQKLEYISKEICRTIRRHNIPFTIKNRVKSVYSIWNKMQKLNVNFEQIYDLTAIRIIVSSMQYKTIKEEKIACWKIFSILSNLYTPIYDIMRDWISMPKEDNGYESLHLTLKTEQKEIFEVQIRTERMDYVAEYGKAAHWRYKSKS